MNLNGTTLTASSVPLHDDDYSITGHNSVAHVSIGEELVSPVEVSPNIPVDKAQTTDKSISDPILVPESSAESDEPSASSEPSTSGATADLEAKLQRAFDGLLGGGGGGESSSSFEEMAQKEKVIVTVDKLSPLFSGPCDAKDCGRQKEVWHKCQGGVLP